MLNSLQANESIFTSPKIALKMIDKKKITFISLDMNTLKITKSKKLDIKALKSSDILGRMSCSPFYVCPKKLEKYFSELGITRDEALVIYDDSYGIKASSLYVLLESMGHKNISILWGGLNDISKLDPNWKIYMNYLGQLKDKDSNQTTLNENTDKIRTIMHKINILKPHLLLQDSRDSNLENIVSNYRVTNIRTEYLLSKQALKEAVKEIRTEKSDITIIDASEMIDIVGSDNGSYLLGVKSLSWRELIDKKRGHLKSNEALGKIFKRLELRKQYNSYIYCMSGAEKAFYVMMALRELGYSKVKAFTGDWNTWVGDINE